MKVVGFASHTVSGVTDQGVVNSAFYQASTGTTFLNIAFLLLFAVLYRLSRERVRNGGATDSPFAIDPVCSMQVEKANAPAHVVVDGRDEWFCSDHCRERFMAGTH